MRNPLWPPFDRWYSQSPLLGPWNKTEAELFLDWLEANGHAADELPLWLRHLADRTEAAIAARRTRPRGW